MWLILVVVVRFLENILYAEAPCQVIGITLEFPEKCSLLFSENCSILLDGYSVHFVMHERLLFLLFFQ
ncbi:hypothetical protein B6A27_16085 [Anoxybacillus sp. UARK-01]|nr:hypothetical protein B6A27_16085 [Anoxybacillus sp. UARK-01]